MSDALSGITIESAIRRKGQERIEIQVLSFLDGAIFEIQFWMQLKYGSLNTK